MNFFDAQDRARRATRWLVVVYVVSTALIVLGVTLLVAFALAGLGASDYGNADTLAMHGPLLTATAIGTALFIVGASLYKTAALSSGGSSSALSPSRRTSRRTGRSEQRIGFAADMYSKIFKGDIQRVVSQPSLIRVLRW